MLVADLKKCELYTNRHVEAQDHSICRRWMEAAAENVNEEMEIAEQSKKDELRQAW